MASLSSVVDSRVPTPSVSASPAVAVPQLDFEHFSQRSVSLDSRGRLIALGFFAAALGVTSIMALMVGAWPVVPFAGLELALLWVAFKVIAKHDGDFEQITIERFELVLKRRVKSVFTQNSFHVPWLRITTRFQGTEPRLQFKYRGEAIEFGSQLDVESRMRLKNSLARWIKID